MGQVFRMGDASKGRKCCEKLLRESGGGPDCYVEITFWNTCAAVAVGSNSIVGSASEGSITSATHRDVIEGLIASASQGARVDCYKKGGKDCKTLITQCSPAKFWHAGE
jgi:hypothetical protein